MENKELITIVLALAGMVCTFIVGRQTRESKESKLEKDVEIERDNVNHWRDKYYEEAKKTYRTELETRGLKDQHATELTVLQGAISAKDTIIRKLQEKKR